MIFDQKTEFPPIAPLKRHRQSCTQCGLTIMSHNATRNAHDVMWKWIGWQRQRRTCYRVQYHDVAWCSIYECLFELSSTTNILYCHLVHNKNTSPPTILEMYVSLPALTEVNTLGEFAPERSVCTGGIEGGGWTCCPCNVTLARPHWVHDCRCLPLNITVNFDLREKYKAKKIQHYSFFTHFF